MPITDPPTFIEVSAFSLILLTMQAIKKAKAVLKIIANRSSVNSITPPERFLWQLPMI